MVYSESVFVLQKMEPWEAEKTVADMEEYSWEDSPSQKNIFDTLLRMKVAMEEEGEDVHKKLLERSEVQEYKDSVTRLKNEGENESTVLQYKEAVKKVLQLWRSTVTSRFCEEVLWGHLSSV